MKNWLYLALCVGLITACRKETIEDVPASNDPVFTMKGEFDGTPLSFTAGKNDMAITSRTEIRNGVKYFISELSNGEYGIALGLFDDQLTHPEKGLTIQAGDTIFMASKSNIPLANLSKGKLSNFTLLNRVDWIIDGVFTGTDNVAIYEPGVYEVCGDFYFNNGTKRQLCNTLYVGFASGGDERIYSFSSSSGQAKAWLEEEIKDVSLVEWRLDGELISSDESCTVGLSSSQGVLEAKIHHVGGSVLEKKILVDGQYQGMHVDDFDVFLEDSEVRPWNKTMGVELINGNVEMSTFLDDNYKNKFIVSEVAHHGMNEAGKEILKISGTFTAKLKAEDSSAPKFIEVDIVFPFILD